MCGRGRSHLAEGYRRRRPLRTAHVARRHALPHCENIGGATLEAGRLGRSPKKSEGLGRAHRRGDAWGDPGRSWAIMGGDTKSRASAPPPPHRARGRLGCSPRSARARRARRRRRRTPRAADIVGRSWRDRVRSRGTWDCRSRTRRTAVRSVRCIDGGPRAMRGASGASEGLQTLVSLSQFER